jgi:hypothetical protein
VSEPVPESEQLALALELADANWPRPADDPASMVDLLRMRPSARALIRRFVAVGDDVRPSSDGESTVAVPSASSGSDGAAAEVLMDPDSRRRLVRLTIDLSTHLTNFGFPSEARRYLLAAEQWVQIAPARSSESWGHARWRVQSALAWAEGLGGNPEDGTLEQRRQRARNRILPLLDAVPERDSLRPTVLSRAARFTSGDDAAGGDRTPAERRRLHEQAYLLASEDDRPAAVFSSTAIRYVGFLRDREDGRATARRIALEAAAGLRERAPNSRPYLLVLAQAASLLRTGAASADDWHTALRLRAESVELARSWLDEVLRWVPAEADGVHRTLAAQLNNQTTLLVNVGSLSQARAACEEAIRLTVSSEQEQPGGMATRRANLADIEFAAGRYTEAVRLYHEAIDLGRVVGSTRTASRLAGAITAALLAGVPVDELGHLVDAMNGEERSSRGFNAHRIKAARGLVALVGGDVIEGLDLLEEAERIRAGRRPVDHPDVLRLRALRVVALAHASRNRESESIRGRLESSLEEQFPGVDHWILALAARGTLRSQ